MEEGEFVNDALDGTFGRKIFMFEGHKAYWTQMGWFSASKLHGYGRIDTGTQGQG